MAEIYICTGRRKQALRGLDRAVELFPTDAEART